MDAKILILEDDQAFAEMLVETLEANDLVAEVSLDPTEAIDRVREGDFDILVSDYLMPKLEGTAFIRRVREFNKTIPVVMISAYMGEVEMRQAAQVGVTRILKKPFEMAELIGEVRALLQEGQGDSSSGAERGSRANAEMDYPQPLRFLRAGTLESRRWVQNLWEAFATGSPIFISGDRGFEVDPLVAEVAGWNDSEGGVVSFDFEASELLSSKARSIITRFAGKEPYSRVIVGKGLDELDRSQQRMLNELLGREDSYLRQGGKITFIFPVDSERLSLAEMSMDEGLLETIFGNLVRVPTLQGRYRDIASYLIGPLADPEAPVLNLSPEAVAFLLRYDWPGNYDELVEVRYRLGKRWKSSALSEEHVRSALEKRLTEPLETVPAPSLQEVLRARQNEVLDGILQSEKKTPGEVLRSVGCSSDVVPASQFPAEQDLLFPELLDTVDAS